MGRKGASTGGPPAGTLVPGTRSSPSARFRNPACGTPPERPVPAARAGGGSSASARRPRPRAPARPGGPAVFPRPQDGRGHPGGGGAAPLSTRRPPPRSRAPRKPAAPPSSAQPRPPPAAAHCEPRARPPIIHSFTQPSCSHLLNKLVQVRSPVPPKQWSSSNSVHEAGPGPGLRGGPSPAQEAEPGQFGRFEEEARQHGTDKRLSKGAARVVRAAGMSGVEEGQGWSVEGRAGCYGRQAPLGSRTAPRGCPGCAL